MRKTVLNDEGRKQVESALLFSSGRVFKWTCFQVDVFSSGRVYFDGSLLWLSGEVQLQVR